MSEASFPPQAIPVLQRALRYAFWYKNDLRAFLRAASVPERVVSRLDWDAYKVRIIDDLIESLLAAGDDGILPIRQMVRGLIELPNLDHLRDLEDGSRKVQEARTSIEALRSLVGEQRTPKSPPARTAQQAPIAPKQPVADLRLNFSRLSGVADAQRRGFEFESFLRDLFEAHDLATRGSFRIQGEQIDGGFVLDGTDYILEAKWERTPQGADPLDAFSRQVERRHGNTLGLFISLSGFTPNGVAAFSHGTIRVLLMDGEDLALVLEGLVDSVHVLRRKRTAAAHERNPYLKVRDILSG